MPDLLPTLVSMLVSVAPPGSSLEPPELGVPFGCGLTFPVSQAHDVGSHLQNDTWAWDFRMPEGTPVVAALDGVVRMTRGDSTTGGCDARRAGEANYVVVSHSNGLETQYLHFSRVVVKAGERVRKGDLLGYSGATGWACGAHLHFKVARPATTSWNNPSVPARLADYGDPQVDALISSPVCPPPGPLPVFASATAPLSADEPAPPAPASARPTLAAPSSTIAVGGSRDGGTSR